MLLRAAVIYVLVVCTLVFAATAFWHGIELRAGRNALALMDQRLHRLQQDLDNAVTDAASAQRAAEAAQDDLQRIIAAQSKAKAPSPLVEQVSALTRERDEARAEAAALARKAEAAREQAARLEDRSKALETQLTEAARATEAAMVAPPVPGPEGGASPGLFTAAIAAVPSAAVNAKTSPIEAAAPAAGPTSTDVPRSAEMQPTAAAAAGEAVSGAKSKAKTVAKPAKKTASKRRKSPRPGSDGSAFFPF